MRARKRGTIVNVSSIGGKVTFPFFGAYHGTKYAVEAFSDTLRYELKPFGINVVVIEPGPIRTNFGDTSIKTAQSYTGTAYAGAIAKATAIQARFEKNAAPPESVAKVIGRVIGKRRPAARYAAPFYNGAIFWLAAVLPQRSWDWVVRRMTFISPKYVTVDEAPAPQAVSKKPQGHAATTHAPN
jgi:short-subunit dehydrogenase